MTPSSKQLTKASVPEEIPYIETFVCAEEPSKLGKCKQNSGDESTNFMVKKFKELKSLLSKKIESEKGAHGGSSVDADSSAAADAAGETRLSVRTIECPDLHTIKVLDAFMTNKNKFICPVPAEKMVDSGSSVCNSTTETMAVVQDLCDNQPKCSINIGEHFQDICTCIDQHYLNLTYICLPSSFSQPTQVKESISKTKRNTLLRGGRNFRLNFVDPTYDFFPQFYTGPLGILGFDISQLGMHSIINEPFPLNYDFFPGNWHGWGGWGNLLDFPPALEFGHDRRPQQQRNGKRAGSGGGYSNGGKGYGGRNGAQPQPFNRGGAGSFKKYGQPIRAGKGKRLGNTKFNVNAP